MSMASLGSLDSINRSDSWSLTESEESASPLLEQDADVAQSPFIPKRERLMRGGPPIYLGEPLLVDVPRFLVGPNRRTPAFRPDTDALGATLLCLKHHTVDLGRLHVQSRMPREHHQTTGITDECVRLWRSVEPEGFVTPALVRAKRSKQQDTAPGSSFGALRIFVAGLTATIAYLMTGSWAPLA